MLAGLAEGCQTSGASFLPASSSAHAKNKVGSLIRLLGVSFHIFCHGG